MKPRKIKPPMKQPSEAALKLAATAWCQPNTADKAMDTELGVAFALIIDEIWAKPAFTKAEELFAEVCRPPMAPSDENVHKPKLKYKCTVCGSTASRALTIHTTTH